MKARTWLVLSVLAGVAVWACSDPYGAEPAPEVEPCAAVSCGAHGRCEAPTATCVCENGYTGPACGSCATGFQDVSGACMPSCTDAAFVCKLHETCVDSAGTRSCVCSDGYGAGADAGTCGWTRNFVDPGFTGTPKDAWTVTPGTSVNAPDAGSDAGGIVDPGLANVKCATGTTGSVTQAVMMPALASAEPLAIELTVKASAAGPSIAFGLRHGTSWSPLPPWQPVPPNANSKRSRICLGDSAYGRAVPFSIAELCGFKSATVPQPDHAAIVAAPDCPAPGQVRGGDFEDPKAWTGSAGPFGGTATVGAGLGYGGSGGGYIEGCGASLSSMASVPAAMEGAAVEMLVKGTGTSVIRYGGLILGRSPASSVFLPRHFCLPPWAAGGTATFSIEGPASGACTQASVDDVKIVADPGCATRFVNDGGFESDNSWADTSTGAGAFARNFPFGGGVHSGMRAMELSTSAACSTASTEQVVSIPKEGAGLRFWYRTADVTVGQAFSVGGIALAPSAAWVQKVGCLNGASSAPAPLRASFARPGGACGTPIPPAGGYVDDVEIFPDPACKKD